MGANFVARIYAGDPAAIKHKFEADQDQDRYESGHSYSGGIGMAPGLTFVDHAVYTEEEAEAWLADHAQKWENALAIRIKDTNYWVIGAWCSS